ncbi:MAG: cell division protein FtsQ/DivIB [bacterium]
MKVYSHYRRKSRHRRRPHLNMRKAGVIFFTITAVVLLLLKITDWLGAQEMFNLKSVKIEGNRFIPKAELLHYVALDSQKNIFDVNLRQIEQAILQHPLVQKVSVSRQLPAVLKIKVYEKQPIAILNDAELTALDQFGNPLPRANPKLLLDLPIISGIHNNSSESNALTKILTWLRYLKKKQFALYSQISEISYSQSIGLYFYLIEKAVPVFVGKASFEKRSENLVKVLNQLGGNLNLANIEYFDLRFDGQVIVKETSRS